MRKVTQVKCLNAMNLQQNSQYLWKIVFSRGSICRVLLELVRTHFTKIDQEKRKIEKVLRLEPHDYRIILSCNNKNNNNNQVMSLFISVTKYKKVKRKN